MNIGIPKEIKDNESRVAITPAGVDSLVKAGHRVLLETNAGIGSGFRDADYTACGAEIAATAPEVYGNTEMIVKVKEPIRCEYDMMKPEQVVFSYLHLAGVDPDLTEVMLRKKIVGIALETIELKDGSLPLLTPMSEIAGRMSVQIGAGLLEKKSGGKGVLLGGVPGVEPAKVVIVGGGVVGTNAAKMAVGLGAYVTVIDKSESRLRYLDDIFGGRLCTLASNYYNMKRAVESADFLIGGVLLPGARAPRLVTDEMVRSMSPGSVIVDVAIDQGGCIETVDRVTTHSNPTYEKYGVIHYSVANMPGAVPRTSTFALTNATLPYIIQLADYGWEAAVRRNQALAKGVNTAYGRLTYQAVADFFNAQYYAVEELLKAS